MVGITNYSLIIVISTEKQMQKKIRKIGGVIPPVSSCSFVHLFSFEIKSTFSTLQLAAMTKYVEMDLRATIRRKNVKVC